MIIHHLGYFAYYIHKMFNLPIMDYDCVYEYTIDINFINFDKNGIYSCYLETNSVLNSHQIHVTNLYFHQIHKFRHFFSFNFSIYFAYRN